MLSKKIDLSTPISLIKTEKFPETLITIAEENLIVFMTVGVKSETMPRDSVCGVILDEKTAKFKISHEGETYYFCSVTCKKKFKRNRRKFVK